MSDGSRLGAAGELGSGARFAAAALAVLCILAGCATGRDIDVRRPLPADVRPFLISPLVGWSEPLDESSRTELERAHGALVDEGDLEGARAAAQTLLERSAEPPPAGVLLGQVELASGDPRAALARLRPIAERYPRYTAVQLALGRAAELSRDLWTALEAYRAAVPSAAATRRLVEVMPAALQVARTEVDAALERARIDEAERWRDRMVELAPDDLLAVDGARAVAAARGDQRAELDALRRLVELAPAGAIERAQLERLAALETTAGDLQRAVDLYGELSREYPEDAALREGLAAAQFRFRLEVLPEEVAELTSAPVLSRGDFATLLYWLVPGARGSRAEAATIVTDVPEEHPQRQAIIRIVNLGLLPMEDPTLRRFGPDRPMTRAAALRALLQVAARSAVPESCLQPFVESPQPSRERVCSVAAACGWIEEAAVCLPDAPLDGPTAERLLRLALGQVGL